MYINTVCMRMGDNIFSIMDINQSVAPRHCSRTLPGGPQGTVHYCSLLGESHHQGVVRVCVKASSPHNTAMHSVGCITHWAFPHSLGSCTQLSPYCCIAFSSSTINQLLYGKTNVLLHKVQGEWTRVSGSYFQE